jgi:two-component system, sensor histidine kinase PdtaS
MPWVHQLSRASIKRQGLLSWTVALAIFTASVVVRFPLSPFLEGLAFITFYPAIVAATLICGWRQGIAVLILSAFAGWYLFLDPTSALKGRQTIGALVVFLLVGGFNVILASP